MCGSVCCLPWKGWQGLPGGCLPPAEPLLTSPRPAVYTQQIHPPTSLPGVKSYSPLSWPVLLCAGMCVPVHRHTHTRAVFTHPLTTLYPFFKYFSLTAPPLPCPRLPCPLTRHIYKHHVPLPPHTDTHAGTPSQVSPLRSWDALTLAHAHGHIHTGIHVIFTQTHSWAGAELGRGPGTAAVLARAHV